MSTQGDALKAKLRYHVTGAIERGEATAIVEVNDAQVSAFDDVWDVDDEEVS